MENTEIDFKELVATKLDESGYSIEHASENAISQCAFVLSMLNDFYQRTVTLINLNGSEIGMEFSRFDYGGYGNYLFACIQCRGQRITGFTRTPERNTENYMEITPENIDEFLAFVSKAEVMQKVD